METKYFEKNGTSFSINTNNNCANILNELILTKKELDYFMENNTLAKIGVNDLTP